MRDSVRKELLADMAEMTGRGRLLFIDNIRGTVIVLVVMVDAAVTYSGLGHGLSVRTL
jgi:uncharacterized membrane protein YcfT